MALCSAMSWFALQVLWSPTTLWW